VKGNAAQATGAYMAAMLPGNKSIAGCSNAAIVANGQTTLCRAAYSTFCIPLYGLLRAGLQWLLPL
jgi:hypothetical protein